MKLTQNYLLSFFFLMGVVAWISFLPAGNTAWAAEVGYLVVEKGLVKVIQQGSEATHRATTRKIPLFAGDEVQTAEETKATMHFLNEEQVVRLYAGTFIRVDEIRPRRSSLWLSLGKALFKVFKPSKTKRFEVNTPTATVGVKGTEFLVSTDGDVYSYVLTLSGLVSVINPSFPTQEVRVGPNQATVVPADGPPTIPVEVPKGTNYEDGDEITLTDEIQVDMDGDDDSQGGTEMAEVVDTTQDTRSDVDKAGDSIRGDCTSAAGCGNLGFNW